METSFYKSRLVCIAVPYCVSCLSVNKQRISESQALINSLSDTLTCYVEESRESDDIATKENVLNIFVG